MHAYEHLCDPKLGEILNDVATLRREKAKAMFYHGYDNYMQHAYPRDELQPLSCTGIDTWGR